MIFQLNQQFNELFHNQPMIFAAPGRVNLIGEHTDYNEGFVLPGAIDKCIYIAIHKNETGTLNAYSNQYNQQVTVALDDLQPQLNWFTYLAGMMHHMRKAGYAVGGVDVIIDGEVPVGAGMSSSAAICSAFGTALNELFSLELDRMQLALLGQKTEHTFAGLMCGIMDQFASLHGKAENVIKLDCRSLEYEYIPFHYPEHKVVLVNSMVSHSLASTEYNVRRQQCEEGVAILKKTSPSFNSLRDVSIGELEKYRRALNPIVYKRCHFVISENARVLRSCELLQEGDIEAFGKLMYESHEGLSKEYEVSCEELDFLAETAKNFDGVIGGRMMGGGFGGCTINIVKASAVEKFESEIKELYNQRFGKVPDVYITQIEEGARRIATNL